MTAAESLVDDMPPAGGLLADATRAASTARSRNALLVRDLFGDERPLADVARRTRVRHLHDALLDTIDERLRGAIGIALSPARAMLAKAGWLGDPALVAFLSRCVDEHRLVIQARIAATCDPELVVADLFGSLIGHDDPAIAAAVTSVLAAGLRRFGRFDEPLVEPGDLPAAVFASLVWRTAAALRRSVDDDSPAIDRMFATAAGAMIADHDRDAGLDGAAHALAARLTDDDAVPAQLAAEGHVAVAIAWLARRAEIPVPATWDMVVDPDGARLVVLLRAARLSRAAAAALLLRWPDATASTEAISARIAGFDALDPDTARAALDRERLPGPYRAALAALPEPT